MAGISTESEKTHLKKWYDSGELQLPWITWHGFLGSELLWQNMSYKLCAILLTLATSSSLSHIQGRLLQCMSMKIILEDNFVIILIYV